MILNMEHFKFDTVCVIKNMHESEKRYLKEKKSIVFDIFRNLKMVTIATNINQGLNLNVNILKLCM